MNQLSQSKKSLPSNNLLDFDNISFASNFVNFLHFQQKQMTSELFKNSNHN